MLIALAAVLGGSVSSAPSPTDPIPDFGAPTGDGFIAKCYWVGTFQSVIRKRGQGMGDAFGQLLSPLCYSQVTDCNFIATEEVDGRGRIRIVLRSAKWSTTVSNLHFWFRPNRREKAGARVKAEGNLPLTGPGAPQLTVTHKGDSLDMNFQIDPTVDSLKFDVPHRTTVMRPRAEWDKGIVWAGGPDTTEHWIAPIHGISASDEPVTPNRRTVIRREWGEPGGSEYDFWVVTRVCEHNDVVVRLITPRGDPVTAPQTSGDGQNEWTFDSATPGKLAVTFKAKVSPASAATRTRDRIRFEMEPIGGSAFAWDVNNPGGRPMVDGGFLVATAISTGLPRNNEDFGKKKVRLLMDGEMIAQTYIEVFFPRDATNNPGARANTPNWFYYYLQTVPLLGPNPKIQHSSILGSQYHLDRNTIYIDDGAIKPYTPWYGLYGPLFGIDTFAWCLTHEMQHYKDFADFWEVDIRGRAKWDAAQGKTGPDDDLDLDSLPNRIEDANGDGVFNAGDLYNWRLRKTPGPPPEILNDFEDWNCKRHAGVRGDHARDWADPGMQHKTLHRYDD